MPALVATMLRFKTIRYYPSSISDEFLNTSTTQDDKSSLHKSILARTGMHLADFSSDDAQHNYFHALVS